MELLYEAGKHISSTLDLSKMYDNMYKIITQVADCNELIVVLYDPVKQQIHYKYLRGKAVNRRVNVGNIPPIPLAPKGYGIVSEVIRTGESIIIDDYPEYYKRVKTKYVINEEGKLTKDQESTESPKSAMVIPIKLNNKVLGAVQIFSREKSAYNKDQQRFVQSLMNQVALANRNANTYEQAQHEIEYRKAAQEELKKSEKNLRQFAESVPEVLFRFDHLTKKFDFLSPVIENMLGYKHPEALDDVFEFGMKVIHPDDFPRLKSIFEKYVKHGRVEAPMHVESRMIRNDGEIIWVRCMIKFEYKSDKIVSVIGAVSDITLEKLREAENRAYDEDIIRRQSALLELLRADTDLINSFLNITENTSRALKIDRASIWMFNEYDSELECKDLFIAEGSIHKIENSISKEDSRGIYKTIKSDHLIINKKNNKDELINIFSEKYLKPHGTTFALITPIRFQGKVVGSIWVESFDKKKTEWSPEELDFVISVSGFATLALETHERKMAEEEIKKSLKDKEMLLREIHHRVKNNLQVISSILFLQAKKSKDPSVIEGLVESQNRVKSMVLIHEKLYKSDDIATFNYSEYIKELTASLFRSYSLDSSSIKLELDVGDIILDTDTAVHCGLLINELVSNSIKHAFPGDKSGVISIHFHHEGEENYSLIVSDNGVGMDKKHNLENKDTLGMQLIETLIDQLNGNMELINNNGTTFKIQFSLKQKS